MPYNPEKTFSQKILDNISSTWQGQINQENGYPIIKGAFGYFMEHCDGVGTKGLLHWKNGTYAAAAIDAFAMNANDLAILGFKPLTLKCHLLIQEEREDIILELTRKLSELCKEYNIMYTGGETAVLNTLEGMEIGVHMSGVVEKPINKILEEIYLVFAYPSNVIHSNGFTLARDLLANEIGDYIEELTKPTRIYHDILNKTSHLTKKRMHITGGAYTKLRRIITQDQDIKLDLNRLETHHIFKKLYIKLVESNSKASYEMLRSFNCGAGYIEGISPEYEGKLKNISSESILIGEITKDCGRIEVKSPFDDKIIFN